MTITTFEKLFVICIAILVVQVITSIANYYVAKEVSKANKSESLIKWYSVNEKIPTVKDANVGGSIIALRKYSIHSDCVKYVQVANHPEDFTYWAPWPEILNKKDDKVN